MGFEESRTIIDYTLHIETVLPVIHKNHDAWVTDCNENKLVSNVPTIKILICNQNILWIFNKRHGDNF